MDRLHATLPVFVKRHAWNLKYGLLGYPRFVAPEDALQFLKTGLSDNQNILELGCGRGALLQGLRSAGWLGTYCGVDISARAIRDARKLHDQRSAWSVSAFESFQSQFQWDAVAMIESICYVKLALVPELLTRIMGMLKDEGFLLVRLHDIEKHRAYINEMRRHLPQTEQVDNNLFRAAKVSHS